MPKLPPDVNAAVKLQCVFRRKVANRKMAKRRLEMEQMTLDERLEVIEKEEEERMRQKEVAAEGRRQLAEKKQREGERAELARMQAAEDAQWVPGPAGVGDRFWGLWAGILAAEKAAVDAAAQAIVDARLEQERLAEEARIRKEREDKEAAIAAAIAAEKLRYETETNNMRAEEAAQRKRGDLYWGIDREIADRARDQTDMVRADAESALLRHATAMEMLHDHWVAGYESRRRAEQRFRAEEEGRCRTQYMEDFYHAKNSDSVLKFRWPDLGKSEEIGYRARALAEKAKKEEADKAAKAGGDGEGESKAAAPPMRRKRKKKRSKEAEDAAAALASAEAVMAATAGSRIVKFEMQEHRDRIARIQARVAFMPRAGQSTDTRKCVCAG